MNFFSAVAMTLLLVFSFHYEVKAGLTFVPEKFERTTAKVVVVIHGCLQSAESMALGTGWNQIADANNLVIIYPQVPQGSNGIDCWNWYLPENQTNNSGQLFAVRTEVINTKKILEIPQAPVFVTGISSGAATVSGLLACFPNEFMAGAVHSGPSYGLAQTLEDGAKILVAGPAKPNQMALPCKARDFKGGVMVLHGTLDKIVNPLHAERVINDFLPDAVKLNLAEKIEGGLTYRIDDYAINGKLRGRMVTIRGLGHAWAGYTANLRHSKLLGPLSPTPTKVPFFDLKGPSSTNLIWDFFKSQNP